MQVHAAAVHRDTPICTQVLRRPLCSNMVKCGMVQATALQLEGIGNSNVGNMFTLDSQSDWNGPVVGSTAVHSSNQQQSLV